ncbi:MAG: hypothetical protein ACP5OG_05945 [Candidatus Nanoarchaeia archaeon]
MEKKIMAISLLVCVVFSVLFVGGCQKKNSSEELAMAFCFSAENAMKVQEFYHGDGSAIRSKDSFVILPSPYGLSNIYGVTPEGNTMITKTFRNANYDFRNDENLPDSLKEKISSTIGSEEFSIMLTKKFNIGSVEIKPDKNSCAIYCSTEPFIYNGANYSLFLMAFKKEQGDWKPLQ